MRGMSITSRTSGLGRFSRGMSHSWGSRAALSATLRLRIACQGGEDIKVGSIASTIERGVSNVIYLGTISLNLPPLATEARVFTLQYIRGLL